MYRGPGYPDGEEIRSELLDDIFPPGSCNMDQWLKLFATKSEDVEFKPQDSDDRAEAGGG